MTAFVRRPDWEARLAAQFNRYRARSFQWGRTDCCTFAADCVRAMTGQDPMRGFRTQYRSKTAAARALRHIGAGTLLATLQSVFGDPVGALSAQRGDVLWDGQNCGICNGASGLFVSASGLVTKPTASCQAVFKLGW